MSDQAVSTPGVIVEPLVKGRRSPLMMSIQVVFGVLLLCAVGVGLWRTTAQSAADATVAGVPTQVLDMKLEQALTGPTALTEIQRLHGENLQIKSAVVATYLKDRQTAELWVADAGSAEGATGLVNQMTAKIGAGNGYFSQPGSAQVDGQSVYKLTGRDQLQHYYYQVGSKVVWLAFPPQRAEDALKAVLTQVH